MKGIHTALVTPFNAAGGVDLVRYEALCERQLRAGIHGLVPCGTTGETPTLSSDEWAAVVACAVRVAGGRAFVTAGIGTSSTTSSVENARRAQELGVDAGLLVFPPYNKPNADGLRQHVAAVADVGLPLVLYHVPGRTGQRLSASLLAELAGRPGVIGVKEATGDLRFVGDLLQQTTTPVLSGDDFTFLPLLSLGGEGCISVASNVAPAQTVAVYEHHRGGRLVEAASLMRALWPLVTLLFSDTNPVPCKAALAELGLCRDDVRLPLAKWQGGDTAPVLRELGLL